MMESAKTKYSQRTVILIILLLIGLLSFFVVSNIVTDPSFNEATIKSLDEKKVTVMRLAATAAATSTALSFIPLEIAKPIANQLAELSTYFIVILSAILLEKMLVAVVGYVSFKIIIPVACCLGALFLYIKADVLRNLAIKLAIFGIILFVAIPISIRVSDLIYSTHQASLEQTIETAEENKEYIEEKKGELSEEDTDWLGKVGLYLSNFTSKIGKGMSDIIKKGEDTFSAFLDAIAVLIITTCVIPIVVILIFVWTIKILFSFDIRIPRRLYLKEAEVVESGQERELIDAQE